MNQETGRKLVEDYLSSISDKFQTGQAREHAYRPDFESLIKVLDGSLRVINDPSRSEHGNPDFVFLRGDVTVGYVETKDIGVDLDRTEKTNQMERYLGYSNLILTDYLEFRFFKNGLKHGENIRIGNIVGNRLSAESQNFSELSDALSDFLKGEPEPIKSGRRLAEIMGGKARRIRDNIKHFLSSESGKNAELAKVYETIRKLLVHDLTLDTFADMYAQTLVYGLFVARYHDPTKKDFSRGEARDLIPKSNPLLQHFFDHIVGPNFDKRLEYIVNELCDVFSHSDIKELLKEYFKNDLWGKTHKGPDPVIHFYEDFLKEYDENLRKKMGAYYTPLPVVQFIVRSVDYLLEKEFGLVDGLADTSKMADGIHKVQVLDPAVGTGTFISDVIGKIYARILKSKQEGGWPAYVHHNLLPRIHAFELMMAPYTIAHLKLSIAFEKTGFKYFNQRLGIYLTNSLEGGIVQDDMFTGFGFAQSIADESKEASKIKNDKPIMVVLGNPPYSVSSSNKGKWIQEQIKVYKEGLGEKKINLDDDYIKFIRFAEHFIEKNKTGIVAMITNNSFIDGMTHRQMRKHLLETFDDLYILNLHGNSKKKEKTPEGGKDENVFDIQQGVSINIFIRKNEKKEKLGTVYYYEIFGRREEKFEIINRSDIQQIKWQKLVYSEPNYFFVPKDLNLQAEYSKNFSIAELMPVYNSGVSTDRDPLFINFSRDALENRIQTLLSGNYDASFASTYRVVDSSSYKLTQKIKGKHFDNTHTQNIQYRIFDSRYIYYDPTLVSRPAYKVTQHFLGKQNIGLIFKRQAKDEGVYTNFFISKDLIINGLFAIDPLGREVIAPLYLYANDGSKTPNLKKEIVDEIEKIVGKTTPEDVLDYIYAILHSPSYREKYKEFLKIDFPRVPYPKDKNQFKALVILGKELRKLHLLESSKLNQPITSYSVPGSDTVEKISYKNGNVFINSDQYFGDVPELAWNFYIGGYQPAQKWLKDRKGRILTSDEISHYQKIIVALVETDRIMKEIEKIEI